MVSGRWNSTPGALQPEPASASIGDLRTVYSALGIFSPSARVGAARMPAALKVLRISGAKWPLDASGGRARLYRSSPPEIMSRFMPSAFSETAAQSLRELDPARTQE